MNKKDTIFITLAAVLFAAVIIVNAALSSGKTEQPTMIVKTLPEETATESGTAGSEASETVTEPIYLDLNAAAAEELMQLPGIGEVLAGEIVSYRERNGGFRNIEELMNIDGIGGKIFERIKDLVYVADPVYETTAPKTSAPTATKTKARTEPVYEESEIYEEYEEEQEEDLGDEQETEAPALTLEDVTPIDLNTAEIWQLELLPYVNEDIAAEIIDLRQRLGRFSHVYELLYVESLEQQQIAEIIPYLEVTTAEGSTINAAD